MKKNRSFQEPLRLRSLQQKNYPERKIAFFILLGTILSGLFFFGKTNFINLWEKINLNGSFEIISLHKKSNNNSKSSQKIFEEINSLVGKLPGNWGIYFYDLQTGEELGINQHQIFTAASVNKVPIILDVLQASEKGAIALDDKYYLKSVDIQDYGTGSMRYDTAGKVYSYHDLLKLAGKQSDNTAAFVLGRILGEEHLKLFLKTNNLTKTSIKENETTPIEMAQLFKIVYQGQLLKKQQFIDIFYNVLTDTDFEERLPAGVPEDVRVVHKIGTEVGIINDCGIVFGSHPYILCIFSQNTDEQQALRAVPEISQIFWDYQN